MNQEALDKLRLELSIKAKNGLDFILAASVIWMCIAYIWTLQYSSYDRSILTFIVGGIMLPLALLISKLLRTTWTVKTNPLQPLGLWLNFAQLFYFPFLIFILIKMPDYFVMVYVIITGAHFFPYSWYYKNYLYAIAAGVTGFGGMILGLMLPPEQMYIIPTCFSSTLLLLALFLFLDFRKKQAKQTT